MRTFKNFRVCVALGVFAGTSAACSDAAEPLAEPVAGEQQAVDDAPPAGCGSWDQISTDFIEDCLLSGGDSIQCSGGDIFCCKTNTAGERHCSTDPNDLGIRIPPVLKAPLQNAPIRAAP